MRGSKEAEYASAKDRNAISVIQSETIIICDGSNSGEVFTGHHGILSSTMGKIFLKEKIDSGYLRAFLGSTFEVFNGAKTGAAIPHLDKEAMYNLQFSYPPLPEQQRIVAILDQAFDGIAAAKANAEKNLQNARALFASHLDSVFSQRGEGWVERKLGDKNLAEIIDGDRGTNYPKASDFVDDGYCLFLNTKNVRPDGFAFETTMFITKEKDSCLRKGKLRRQDVILTTRGTIGNVGLYSDDVEFEHVRINSGMLIFRVNQRQLLPSFLFEMLRSPAVKTQIKEHTSGAAQPQLPIKTLVNFTIFVPTSLEEQQMIVGATRKLLEQTQRLEAIYRQKLAALDELKKSLLHQAFAGEL